MLLAGDEWVYVAGDGVFAVDRALDDPRRIATAEIFSAHDRQQVWLANGTDLRTYPIATALPDQPHDAVAFGSRVAWADADDVVRLVDGATAETWELGVGRPVGVTAHEVVVRRAGPGRFETVGIDDSGASAVLAALDLQLGAFLPSPGGAALAATTSTAGVPARQRTVLVEPRSLAVDQLGAVPHSARPLVWRAAWIDDTRLALLVEDGNGDQSVSVHDRSTRTTRTVLVVERDTLASWLAAAPR